MSESTEENSQHSQEHHGITLWFRHHKLLSCVLVAAIASLVAWFVVNPPGRFGYCGFGFTVYGCIPHILSDVQVRADGEVRTVEKTHDLAVEHIDWVLEDHPDILIIGTGWSGVTQVGVDTKSLKGCKIIILKAGEAIELFNKLKKDGKRVAIHLHSTC